MILDQGITLDPRIFGQKIFANKNVLLEFDTEDPSLVLFVYVFCRIKIVPIAG